MKRISLLPLACYVIILCYAAYAASLIRHWPYYAHPDPKDLPSPTFLYAGAALVMLTGVLSVLTIPIGYSIARVMAVMKKQALAPHGIWILWFIAGSALWILDFVATHTDVAWVSMIGWLLP